MITKTVIKDYVAKRCPYLASLELEDKSLVKLLEKSLENRKKYQELALIAKEENSSQDSESEEAEENVLDLVEVLRNYPYLKNKIKYFDKHQKKNAVEELIEQYNDDQIVSKLSRRYFELQCGKENCVQCDENIDGSPFISQEAMVSMTSEALKDKSKKVIFEAQIEHQDLRARADVLVRNDDGSFDIYEVKGTNDVFKHSTDKKTNLDYDKCIKDKYLYDMLFQYYVYSCAGLNIKNLYYLFTNRDFRITKHTYPTADEDLEKLFVKKNYIDLKEGRMSLIQYFDADLYVDKKQWENEEDGLIENLIFEIRKLAGKQGIKPKEDYFCCKGSLCPFLGSCFGEEAEGPNSIFKLTKWSSFGGDWRRTRSMINNGIKKISNIEHPETYGINEFRKKDEGILSNAYSQIAYQKGLIKESYLIKKDKFKEILLRDYLNNEVDYLLFFDFESFQYPIPLVEYSAAWKQVVSQYSMHVCEKGYDLSKHDFKEGKGGGVRHFEYIANPDITGYTNPSIELYTTLKSQLEECGIDPMAKNYRVVVFNENFERSRMKDFIFEFPALADPSLVNFVRNFRENVVDLLDFFTSGAFYGRDFNGRGSLKVVQPTLGADKDVLAYYKKILPFDLAYSLDYHKGDSCLVYNGGICLDLYKSLLVRSHLGEQNKGLSTKDLLAEALAYCKIDSWGTVIIYDIIKNIYLGKLKLDALIK